MATATSKEKDNELLNDFNSLFKRKNLNDICESTQLRLTSSLNYSLKTCLFLEDQKWVLAIIDIDNLKVINEETNYSDANFVIETIGRAIKTFCDEKLFKTKGFKYQIHGKGDMFAVLLRYSKKIENVESRINRLKEKIDNVSKVTVSIGMATIDIQENGQEWINRAVKYMMKAKNENFGNSIVSDIRGFDPVTIVNTDTNLHIVVIIVD